MPFSDAQGKDAILSWVKDINPRTILDIGPGAGAYFDLLKDHTPRAYQFNALEIWAPYIKKYALDKKYEHVYISDIREAPLDNVSCYDLVILGDIIEHMKREEAKEVILRLASNEAWNYNLIISFPVLHLEQGAYEGNPYETHVDHWSYDEMMEFCKENNLDVVASGHGDVLAWFWIQLDSSPGL